MRATLADLKARALRKADLPASTTTRVDAIVVDSELGDALNDGFDELHDLVLEERQNHFEVTSQVQAESGAAVTPLPDCWLCDRGIWLIEGGIRARLEEYILEDLAGTSTGDTSSRPRYRIQGSVIRWLPVPASSYLIEMTYLRSFRRLFNDADTSDPEIPEGWLRYPVAYAAAYIMIKREKDPTAYLGEMQRIARSIGALALRKETGGSFVRDTSGRFDGERLRSRLPWPRI